MVLFDGIAPAAAAAYGIGGPGALAVLLTLAAVRRPGRRADVEFLLLPLLVAILFALAVVCDAGGGLLRYLGAQRPWLCALAGVGALAVALALAAAVWPRRGVLLAAGAAFVATLVAGGGLAADIRGGVVDELFWRDGDALVRVAIGSDWRSSALGEPLDMHLTVLFVASLAALVAAPLLAAAGLRVWGGEARGAKALGIAAVALPLVTIGAAVMVHVLASLSDWGCASIGPVDRGPGIVRQWSRIDEQRIAVLAAGGAALALGAAAAVRLARAGIVAGNRRLLAALAVFVVGGGCWLYTRAHAADTATGPRAAFVGVPFAPFGEAARDWLYPDFIEPPVAIPCSPVRAAPDAALEITANGERVANAVDVDDDGLPLRGVAAWERALAYDLRHADDLAESKGLARSTVSVAAVIDRAAPLERVLPYLRATAAEGVREVLLVARLHEVASTRTLGEVRVDKLCAFGTLDLTDDLPAAGRGTWGDLVRIVVTGGAREAPHAPPEVDGATPR